MQLFGLVPIIIALATLVGVLSAVLVSRIPASILERSGQHGRFAGLGSSQQKCSAPDNGGGIAKIGVGLATAPDYAQ
jgi:hypothetical protein